MAAMPTAGPGATGRQVYRAELTLNEDSEYYVELATAADPHALQWPAGLWLANALNPRDLGRPPDVISLPCHVGGAVGGVAYACGVSLLGAPL